MPSDLFIDTQPKDADDRSSQSLNTRAKVILSHVAWLLQSRAIREIGEIEFGQDGYVQRFAARGGTNILVAVTPTEPARVKVAVHTKPILRFLVDGMGEDGKTMDISQLAERVADGITHLSNALKLEDEESNEVTPKEGTSPTNELNPNAMHGGRTSKEVHGRPDSGDVTVQVRERHETPIGKDEGEQVPDTAVEQKLPTQFVAQLTAFLLRLRKVEIAQSMTGPVERAINAAKADKVAQVKVNLDKVSQLLDQAASSPSSDAILRGIRREFADLRSVLDANTDQRSREEKKGMKDSAVDRLRAVAKPPQQIVRAVGSTRVIAPRTRGAVGESIDPLDHLRLLESMPPHDGFARELSTSQYVDLKQLFTRVIESLLPGVRMKTLAYSERLDAWTVASEKWSASFRCEFVGTSGACYGWLEMFGPKKGLVGTKTARVSVWDFHAGSYDDLAIQIAQKIGEEVRRMGLARSR